MTTIQSNQSVPILFPQHVRQPLDFPLTLCRLLSVSLLLYPLLKALDFSQHIFGPGLHFKVGQFAVFIVFDSQFVLNGIEQ